MRKFLAWLRRIFSTEEVSDPALRQQAERELESIRLNLRTVNRLRAER
jgi:hypothetical protein